MDSFKSKTYEIDYKNTISESSILKSKDIYKTLKDSTYTPFINQALQGLNLRWLYPTLSAVLLMEMISGYKRFSTLFEMNMIFKVSFSIAVIIQFVLGIMFLKIGKESKYKRTYDILIHMTLLHFVVFQGFFYLVGATNNQNFFYFVSASVAIATFPAIHTKYIAVYSILNYIIFVIVVVTKYWKYSPLSACVNAFYVLILSFVLSISFFTSRINMLINEKKISMFAKEMAITNDQLNFLNEELEKLSFIDTLTNISNRRSYEQEIGKIWANNMRSQTPITLMMIDIDFFKRYNDYFGHPRGDVCLSDVAMTLKACFKRCGDVVARFGGEEFVVALSSVEKEQGKILADKVVKAIYDLKIEHPKNPVSPYVTVSVGVVSTIPQNGVSPQTALDVADKALYKAKRSGRNKFCYFDDSDSKTIEFKTTDYEKNNDLERLRQIVKVNSLCTFSIYYDTGKIEFSKDIFNLINTKSEKLNSFLDLYEHVVPEDIKNLDVLVNSLFDSDFESAMPKFRIIKKDLTYMWVKAPCILIKSDDGTPLYIAGSFIDINDETEEKNNLENIVDGTFSYNLITNKGSLKGEFIKKLTETETEIEFSEFLDFVFEEDKYILENFLESAINKNKNVKLDFEIRVKTSNKKTTWISVKTKFTNNKNSVYGRIIELNNLDDFNKNINTFANRISNFSDRTQFCIDFEKIVNENKFSGFIFMIDIDDFSTINNIFNYSIGNRFLKEFAKLIDKSKTLNGNTYHFNGDIFVVFFPEMNIEEAKIQLEEFKNIKNNSEIYKDFNYDFTFSTVCIEYPKYGKNVDELLRNADTALRSVKDSEKDSVFFSTELLEEKDLELKFELELRESISDNMRGFMIYYHPLLSAKDDVCVGAEALLRWKNKDDEIIPPMEFIPILEKIGLMNKLGKWVLETASAQCKEWIDLKENETFAMSINITANQLIESNFEEDLINHLEAIGLDFNRIILELTESELILDFNKSVDKLNFLRQKGIRIAIDDFGTGYSSLSYLRDLPVDEIKIDKSFITDIETDGFNREFVNSIIKISQRAKRITCIEGVETKDQAEILKGFNANILQGFLFSKPIPKDEFKDRFLK